ncbi:hypothetical protein B0T22DRAFT_511675 [Podospora appendiculata]|uniref:Uncharacterized protein n=1 Tax=Podospora appendiculata TaxID=314037 RepID=A0AAE0X976_9PEZI|nr:hypothetical protein B0T22DRAFT_511675 [Podospora appendiculata]
MHPENQPSSASTTTIQNTRLAHLLQNLLVSGHGTPRKLPTLLMLTTQLVLLSLVLAGTAAAGQIPTINVSAPLAQRNEPMTITAPGSACPGAEGQWNCMTASWQRCASGRWSVVMPCAAGTQCLPAGLSYDFRIERTTAAGGSEAPGGVPGIGPGGEWGPYRSGGVGGMKWLTLMCCHGRDPQGQRDDDLEKPSAAKREAELVIGFDVREYLEQELDWKPEEQGA